ncbi:MAG: nucleotidyltransferase family protein [Myxococcota bacterium]
MDVSPYIDGWRQRARLEEQARELAVRMAREAVPRAIAVFRRHGAKRIWLIGSLPRGTFRPGSDLDFMVEGLDEDIAWSVASKAADSTGLGVDVIRFESLDDAWRTYHQRYGELVDE